MQVAAKHHHSHAAFRRTMIFIAALAAAIATLFFTSSLAAGAAIAPAPSTTTQFDLRALWTTATDFVQNAFDTTDYQPRWQTETWGITQSWFHISSDAILGAIYVLFGVLLLRMHRQQRNTPFARLIKIFGIFLIVGGTTYLLDSAMFWWPAYRLTTLTKLAAAVLSIFVAALFIPAAPKIAALRSPVEIQQEITQRRKTELELRRIHAELEGVIQQRTAELAAKNVEMEQFLNTVSHDLKSPVVTCLGLTGMLREDLKAGRTAESAETVDRIERSATRMRQLIEDLLNLARLGQIRFEMADVNSETIVRSICEEYQPRLAKIGATIGIDTPMPTVHADAHWLTEVFENLITNAMKYGCDNPNPTIKLGCVTNEKEHQFFVRDNGAGIDPAHHAQILEPFRRLRTDKEGSGMGLAIVLRIIKMHGGRIWIDSQPGKGATFFFALPIDQPNKAAPVASGAARNSVTQPKGVRHAA
jgi:signal transduction histidine kinase